MGFRVQGLRFRVLGLGFEGRLGFAGGGFSGLGCVGDGLSFWFWVWILWGMGRTRAQIRIRMKGSKTASRALKSQARNP